MSLTILRVTALLVIDVQQSFKQRDVYDNAAMSAFFERCTRLVRGFEAAGLPVVRVLHEDGDGPFARSSGHVVPMPEVAFDPAATFTKRVHSALYADGLHAWLNAHGVARLAVCGIRTEQCCETTTRHASDAGFEVDYVGEATATWPMTTAAGRVVSADEIRERTELVLAKRFATIVTVDEAIARAVAAAHVAAAA